MLYGALEAVCKLIAGNSTLQGEDLVASQCLWVWSNAASYIVHDAVLQVHPQTVAKS